ncbi:MAG: sugar ABC transporter ATP-binding protein, partial [Actinomycetia bacterium]|nr:sugar ABC transporter ATP-binding protein [Actinomycetes bacterium]
DRVTVLRDGHYVDTLSRDDITEDRLLELMTGRVIDQVFPSVDSVAGAVALRVSGLTTADRSVTDIGFEVHSGEIVGFAGLVGSGKSSAARACFGVEQIHQGTIELHDVEVTGHSPRRMLRRGMFYLPSDRKTDGLMMMRGVRENIALPCLRLGQFSKLTLLRRAAERQIADDVARRVELNPHALERPVEHFSGGNQQKILLARALARDVDVFIFDEPTVG